MENEIKYIPILATNKDISEISSLCIEVWGDEGKYSEEFYSNILLYELSYIYKEKNKIIAACLIEYDEEKDITIISIFCVKKEYRRKGIGTSLLNFCINNCIKNGYPKFNLQVAVTNEEAINLYKKLGFEITEKLVNYYNVKPPDNDAYLMLLDRTNEIDEMDDKQFEELIKKFDDIHIN